LNHEDRIPLFAQIRNDMDAAKNRRELDRAAADISRIANTAHQRQLSALYQAKKQTLKP
jgi:hypothetical protein